MKQIELTNVKYVYCSHVIKWLQTSYFYLHVFVQPAKQVRSRTRPGAVWDAAAPSAANN